MVRTQISLTEEQHERLRKRAETENRSMSSLVRDGVDRVLADDERERRWDRAIAVGGKFSSGLGDLGVNHDKYLDEDFG